MSLDITVLRLLRVKEKFSRLRRMVPDAALQAHTIVLLKDYARYFREFPDVEEFDFQKFWPLFRMWHPNLKDEAVAVFNTVLRQIDQPIESSVEQGIAARLVAADCADQLATLLTRWNDGEEVDLHKEVLAVTEYYETAINKRVSLPVVNDSIYDLLKEDENDVGFHWRLACLNRSLRPLRPGDFGIIAGRPDKGKTTFFASELSYMMKQVETVAPGKNIVIFNNEGLGSRVKKRFYQSALDAPYSTLIQWVRDGTLDERYIEAVGDPSCLKILDVHDWWSHDVENAIKQLNPALILFDMIDNIRFGGDAANNGQRTDQLLEAQYQWARVLGVKYNCAVLATSQISADGDGIPYPTLSMLKDSKTGKQGAADFIITIGASNDPMLANSRFIGCTKNKLAREGNPRDPRCEVIFDGETGRFRDAG